MERNRGESQAGRRPAAWSTVVAPTGLASVTIEAWYLLSVSQKSCRAVCV